ncbi:hypothetical protein [Streptomyces roseicoloratus]|uniref:hypothetical protein n=1 Tax=Streptomyces roseicoloratus TaxID=2508722 RepID=UPI001009D559|nr:hypothetical protein [Streptomyces roseicoloratus]
MQPSAVTDLAHTHARPVHWLTTATAMAAVVALAGLLQPGSAGAAGAVGAHAAPAARPAPDAGTAPYPLECGGAPSTIARQATGDLDGDGNPETVAVVHCEAGSGTPPSGVYVLTHGKGTGTPAARVVATLVDPTQQKTITDFTVRDGAVHATLLGYSGPRVPSCCPDQSEQVTWRWQRGTFVRTTQDQARSV